MEQILPILRFLLEEFALRGMAARAGRLTAIFIVGASVGIVLGTLAAGFVAFFAYEGLAPRLGPANAAGVVAGGLVILTLLWTLGCYLMLHSARKVHPAIDPAVSFMTKVAPALAIEAGRQVKRNLPSLALVSLCGGFVAGVMMLHRRR